MFSAYLPRQRSRKRILNSIYSAPSRASSGRESREGWRGWKTGGGKLGGGVGVTKDSCVVAVLLIILCWSGPVAVLSENRVTTWGFGLELGVFSLARWPRAHPPARPGKLAWLFRAFPRWARRGRRLRYCRSQRKWSIYAWFSLEMCDF